jgi:hypothetical protein
MVIVQHFGRDDAAISLTSDLLPGYGTFGWQLPLLGDLASRTSYEAKECRKYNGTKPRRNWQSMATKTNCTGMRPSFEIMLASA